MKHFIIGGCVAVTAVLVPSVHAAELSVEPSVEHTGPGFSVQLVLQYDQAINALEGVLTFDEDVVRVSRILESPNGLPLWVHRPSVSELGTVRFAGIFPGGIEPRLTDRLTVFEVFFEVMTVGETTIDLSDVRVLLHRPVPTEDSVRLLPLTVRTEAGDIGPLSVPADAIPPEPFTVSVMSDTELLNGQPIAVYRTRDLQSGVERYELRERFLGLFGSFRSAEGISELSGLWRFSIIEVRATDRAGNSTIARHIPATVVAVYVLFGLLGIMSVRRSRRSRV